MSLDLEKEEIGKILFEESFEGLDVMESSLLNLDVNADRETIAAILQAVHSIKGGAATSRFMEVSTFTHGVATLPDAIQLLLQPVDGLREMVKAVEATQPIDAKRIALLVDAIAQPLARHPGTVAENPGRGPARRPCAEPGPGRERPPTRRHSAGR